MRHARFINTTSHNIRVRLTYHSHGQGQMYLYSTFTTADAAQSASQGMAQTNLYTIAMTLWQKQYNEINR